MSNLQPNFQIGRLRTAADIKGPIKGFISESDLIKLAEDYRIPHYTVKNPITGFEGIYFLQEEVESWFQINCVTKNGFDVEQRISFFNFNNAKTVVVPGTDVPEALTAVKTLYQVPLENMFGPPGIYFLCLDREIVYIGQSINVASRVIQHINDSVKAFNQAFFIACHRSNLLAYESALIKFFRPKYNGPQANFSGDEKSIEIIFGQSI